MHHHVGAGGASRNVVDARKLAGVLVDTSNEDGWNARTKAISTISTILYQDFSRGVLIQVCGWMAAGCNNWKLSCISQKHQFWLYFMANDNGAIILSDSRHHHVVPFSSQRGTGDDLWQRVDGVICVDQHDASVQGVGWSNTNDSGAIFLSDSRHHHGIFLSSYYQLLQDLLLYILRRLLLAIHLPQGRQ